jgi:hypothetical protein
MLMEEFNYRSLRDPSQIQHVAWKKFPSFITIMNYAYILNITYVKYDIWLQLYDFEQRDLIADHSTGTLLSTNV